MSKKRKAVPSSSNKVQLQSNTSCQEIGRRNCAEDGEKLSSFCKLPTFPSGWRFAVCILPTFRAMTKPHRKRRS